MNFHMQMETLPRVTPDGPLLPGLSPGESGFQRIFNPHSYHLTPCISCLISTVKIILSPNNWSVGKTQYIYFYILRHF